MPTNLETVKICPVTPTELPNSKAMSTRSSPARNVGNDVTVREIINDGTIFFCSKQIPHKMSEIHAVSQESSLF